MLNHWPNPSRLSHFLLENPWPALAIFLVFALIFAWHYLQKRKRPLLILALISALVAAVVPLLAYFITTPRERLIQLDSQLVHAVAPDNLPGAGPDMPTLQRLFSPTINFQITQSITQSQQVQPLLDLIQRVTRKYKLSHPVLLANDARSTPPTPGSPLMESYFQVRVKVTATDEAIFSGSDMPVVTDWLVQWAPQPDGSYKIVTLRWLKIGNQDPLPSQLP